MLKIRSGVIYYIKRVKSGYMICRIPKIEDAELVAAKIQTEEEIEQIVEEDSKCWNDCH